MKKLITSVLVALSLVIVGASTAPNASAQAYCGRCCAQNGVPVCYLNAAGLCGGACYCNGVPGTGFAC